MNISMQLTVVVVAACLCLADSAPDGRLVRKQQRPTRGFKNVEMMTARGFGKRSRIDQDREDMYGETPYRRRFDPKNSLMVAKDFGKRSTDLSEVKDFLRTIGFSSEVDRFDPTVDSVPVEYMVNAMMHNRVFTEAVVREFIDTNKDGLLTMNELLRYVDSERNEY